MKKTVLILLIFITVSTGAFCAEIPDDLDDSIFSEDVIATESAPSEESATDKHDSIKEAYSDKIAEINSMQNDEEKVKAWAKFNAEKNYVIIDKKDCSAAVYNQNGEEIDRFEVGIGKEIGDDFNDTRGVLGKAKNTTPAGEYTLITNVFNKSAYGDVTLSLGAKANKPQDTKKVVALHKVPKFRQQDRLKKFYDGDLANNRMSHGCINFIEDDFKKLTKYIHGGLKTYILPEEEGNKLMLTQTAKGKFELTQTKY